MNASRVSAVLFAKDLQRVARFYSDALEMKQLGGDGSHTILDCHGFQLIVHQIPQHIADEIVIQQPPERRIEGAIRIDYPLRSMSDSRARARSLGGDIDELPPEWADREANFFFGYDPEGNQFGCSENAG